MNELKQRLAVAVICKNEGGYALEMLRSIIPIAGFVSIVDNESSDGSPEIMGNLLKIFGIPHAISSSGSKDFSELRNISTAGVPDQYEWILAMDCDEILLEKDFFQIYQLISQDEYDAWLLPRFNWIDKIWGNHASYPDYQGRLFKNLPKNKIQYTSPIHETLIGFENLGTVAADESPASGGLHIHHVKLFNKTSGELAAREEQYQKLASSVNGENQRLRAATLRVLDDALQVSEESDYDLSVVRRLHAFNLSGVGILGEKAMWCEWNHELESARPLKSIFLDLVQRRWNDLIRPGSTCIDIGAHSGDTTIPMGVFSFDPRTGRKGRIVAVEPNPEVFKVLKINLEINAHLANFCAVPAAITKNDYEEVTISDHGNANCNGGIIDGGFSRELEELLLSSRKNDFKAFGFTLPTLFGKLAKEDQDNFRFLKIDCEGFDKEILRSSREFLSSKRPFIQIEWFDWFSRSDAEDLFSVISEIGYSAFDVYTREPASITKKVSDLLLIPD